jgi:hypothetical protein
MRELSNREIGCVSGGVDEEIVVIGQRRIPGAIYMDDVMLTGMSLGDYLFGMQMNAESGSVVEWAEFIYKVLKDALADKDGDNAKDNSDPFKSRDAKEIPSDQEGFRHWLEADGRRVVTDMSGKPLYRYYDNSGIRWTDHGFDGVHEGRQPTPLDIRPRLD